uniref:Immunoglobulin domain-containing protein n=1 Tax=Mola mola TaxID=94237 RepID=A0A3Q4C0B5_MOLML
MCIGGITVSWFTPSQRLFILNLLTKLEASNINVQGLERGEVQFHCSHTLAWYNQKYLCKDPCKTGEDVLLTVQSGQVVESGRITLVDLGDGHSSVTFSQLRLSDSGRYWCGVDRLGFDTFTEIYLTVKEGTYSTWPSPIWTSPAVSKSTQLTAGMHTSMPTNHSSGSKHFNPHNYESWHINMTFSLTYSFCIVKLLS